MIVEYETGIVIRITERAGPVFHVQVISPEPAGHWWEWRGLTIRVGQPIEFRGYVQGASPAPDLADCVAPGHYRCGIVARIRPRG